MSSLCQLRPGWGGEVEGNKTKYLENWNSLRKQQRLIPPASSSMHTSRRSFPLATGAAGCLLLSQLGSRFSQMAMHCSHKLTATKTQQPQHNTTIYLFILSVVFYSWPQLPNWYPGRPKALFLIYRAFHSLEPNYLQKLLPPPHLLPWQLQSAEMFGLANPDLLGYQRNSKGLSL